MFLGTSLMQNLNKLCLIVYSMMRNPSRYLTVWKTRLFLTLSSYVLKFMFIFEPQNFMCIYLLYDARLGFTKL